MSRQPLPVRVSRDELQTIDAKAAAMGLTRTEYVISKLTDTLPQERESTQARLDNHEQRLVRLEQLALGYE